MDECAICYELLTSADRPLKCCTHTFHSSCLEKVVDDRCPLCRRYFRSRRSCRAHREISDDTLTLASRMVAESLVNAIVPSFFVRPEMRGRMLGVSGAPDPSGDASLGEVTEAEFNNYFSEDNMDFALNHAQVMEITGNEASLSGGVRRSRHPEEDRLSEISDEENPHGDNWDYEDV